MHVRRIHARSPAAPKRPGQRRRDRQAPLAGDPAAHAYEAAGVAAETRARPIELRRSFIAESVFSHPSKLELIDTAHAAGHNVVLHALLVPEELAVQRVRHRVDAGGHHVPEDKIPQRFQRLWGLVVAAVARCDSTTVYDNSVLKGPASLPGWVAVS